MDVKTMDKIDRQIGFRIREMREQQRYKKEHFAGKADISVDFLCDVEDRQSNISLSKLFKICDALNISPAYILSGVYDDSEEFKYLFNRVPSNQKPLAIRFLVLLAEHQSP